jgi:hypothetical protein
MEPQPARERTEKVTRVEVSRNFGEVIPEVYWILNLGGIKVSKPNALKID